MTVALWQWDELVAAAGGRADVTPAAAITGFSIDTRSLAPGEVFVALKDQRDGHEFVGNAFKAGAAAALVCDTYERKPGDGALLRVADTLDGLRAIGVAARARLAADARVVAVTGSAGKTGTKEMLRACYEEIAPGRVHASDKSFNNHWGVPLTLARMPAETRFAVFEIGMNHAGEITPLAKLVCPHAGVITTVEAVHLAQFASVDEIADAKAEIMAGIGKNGVAVLNRDNPHFARLARHALAAGVRVVSFGMAAEADVRAVIVAPGADGSDVAACVAGENVTFRVAIPGTHIAMNALAVAAVLKETAGIAGLHAGLDALERITPPPGRGVRTELATPTGPALLIDESYNANPASMRATLATTASLPRDVYRRRVAVLGDMLELGADAEALHRDLARPLTDAGFDLLFASGPYMKALYEAIDPQRRGAWSERSDGLRTALLGAVRGGDVIVVKGSNGSRMAPLAEALRAAFSPGAGGAA